MAISATLAFQGRNHLRYLVTYNGTSGTGTSLTLTTDGSATPDLRTDSLGGPLKQLANAGVNGYGNFAAGALTQAQARALWLSNYIGANPAAPSGKTASLPTAFATVSPGPISVSGLLSLDADVSAGVPVIRCAVQGDVTTASSWYLDIFIPGAVGA